MTVTFLIETSLLSTHTQQGKKERTNYIEATRAGGTTGVTIGRLMLMNTTMIPKEARAKAIETLSMKIPYQNQQMRRQGHTRCDASYVSVCAPTEMIT